MGFQSTFYQLGFVKEHDVLLLMQWAALIASCSLARDCVATLEKKMDVGGNGGGLAINNKQRAMLPNKSRGEFIRNQRKDSEVSSSPAALNPQSSCPSCRTFFAVHFVRRGECGSQQQISQQPYNEHQQLVQFILGDWKLRTTRRTEVHDYCYTQTLSGQRSLEMHLKCMLLAHVSNTYAAAAAVTVITSPVNQFTSWSENTCYKLTPGETN